MKIYDTDWFEISLKKLVLFKYSAVIIIIKWYDI